MRLKSFFAAAAAMFIGLSANAQEPKIDSTKAAALDLKLEQYFKAMEAEPFETKTEECDYILNACNTAEVRNYVAIKAYDHFLYSKLMGDEAVAIWLTDNWFIPGKAKFSYDIDLLNARIFAGFNRRSLIGKRAPALRLFDPEGEAKEVLGVADDSLAAKSDVWRVLYFYDTGCLKCKIETPQIQTLLKERDWPLEFNAIYVGSDEAAWKKWRESNLQIEDDLMETEIDHWWDPELKSDFQMKYGVLQTPKMFLIDKDGVIVGRGLDAAALDQLMESLNKTMTYGSDESEKMYDEVFAADSLTSDSVVKIARHIARRTLYVKDTLNFKQMEGDLLYYASTKRGEAYKKGTLFVADSLVLGKPEIWNTDDDQLKVVSMAKTLHDMMNRAAEGTRIPDLTVKGKLISAKGTKTGSFNLRSLDAKYSYVMFYSEGCNYCAAEEAAIDSLFKSTDPQLKKIAKNTQVLMVDMDETLSDRPEDGYLLLDTFDLSSLPYITLQNQEGVVKKRYFSFVN